MKLRVAEKIVDYVMWESRRRKHDRKRGVFRAICTYRVSTLNAAAVKYRQKGKYKSARGGYWCSPDLVYAHYGRAHHRPHWNLVDPSKLFNPGVPATGGAK